MFRPNLAKKFLKKLESLYILFPGQAALVVSLQSQQRKGAFCEIVVFRNTGAVLLAVAIIELGCIAVFIRFHDYEMAFSLFPVECRAFRVFSVSATKPRFHIDNL